VRLFLSSGGARPWRRSGGTWARGTAYGADGPIWEGAALAAHLDGPPATLGSRVAALSGTFAVVCEREGTVAVAADRIRSFGLVWGRDADGTLCLGDDALALAHAVGARLDSPEAAAELMLQSAVVGPSTLSTAVRGAQAGEAVVFRDGEERRQRWARYADGPALDVPEADLVEEGARLLERAFDRMIASVRGRPVVVPLSGGMDSRLVAALLARGGRTDALCFTYGRRYLAEPRASQRVAESLGLQWAFVPYSYRRWHRWGQSGAFRRYQRRAAGLAAIEHEQDWPAVGALRQRGLVPEGAVFVPGHAGDFLGGSHLAAAPEPAERDPVALARAHYYVEWPTRGLDPDLGAALDARIAAEVGGAEGPRALLRFGWQERQAKVIANSVRVYEDHGYDWRLPFWADADVFDFWGRVPVRLLRGRRLYDAVLRRLMGDDLFDLPNTLRPPPLPVRKLNRLTNYGHGAYGIWLGPRPALGALRLRVGDVARADHSVVGPVVRQLAGPVAGRPLPWATVNGLLAVDGLRRLAGELG
jgi:asparagine synthase (glutamine-hydrolysing)